MSGFEIRCVYCQGGNITLTLSKTRNGQDRIKGKCNECGESDNVRIYQGDDNPDFKMPFGKHEGKSLKEIQAENPQYLEWASEKIEPVKIRKRISLFIAQQ